MTRHFRLTLEKCSTACSIAVAAGNISIRSVSSTFVHVASLKFSLRNLNIIQKHGSIHICVGLCQILSCVYQFQTGFNTFMSKTHAVELTTHVGAVPL